MTARLFAILLFLVFPFTSNADEQQVIDSLESVIDNPPDDTSEAQAYMLLVDLVYITDLSKAEEYNSKAREMAEDGLSANPGGLVKRAFQICLADGLNNVGFFIKQEGDLTKALDYYDQSLQIREDLEDKEGIVVSLINIGRLYDDQGNIEKVLECYDRAMSLGEEIGDSWGVAMTLNNIGSVYEDQGDQAKAMDYYTRSLGLLEEVGDRAGVATALGNIGLVYSEQGDQVKAMEYYNRSLKIKEEIGDMPGIAYSLNNIGAIVHMEGDFAKALEYYLKSLEIRKEHGGKRLIASGLKNVAGTYLDLGNVEEADKYASKMLTMSNELGNPYLIKPAADLLKKIAIQSGDFEKALEMYELHILMSDSLKNEKTQKATIRQQTKYEFEKAQLVKEQEEKEASRLVAEETSRRDNLQYSIIVLALLAMSLGIVVTPRLRGVLFTIPPRLLEGAIFFTFLILFEFILVLADPYIETWSSGAPGIKLLFNAGIAALIFPLHAFFESKIKGRLVK